MAHASPAQLTLDAVGIANHALEPRPEVVRLKVDAGLPGRRTG